eukprot:TRINITY_DN5915_c0_g1_i2.p1 TRINITY_DN5915_c0_g1~~TRINITY_DN5915_c0_g1_i2.p1  ORF type:complete len:299 (+),score=70.40 TRINITY_DN5915_c0_g1_i2:67-963(+)
MSRVRSLKDIIFNWPENDAKRQESKGSRELVDLRSLKASSKPPPRRVFHAPQPYVGQPSFVRKADSPEPPLFCRPLSRSKITKDSPRPEETVAHDPGRFPSSFTPRVRRDLTKPPRDRPGFLTSRVRRKDDVVEKITRLEPPALVADPMRKSHGRFRKVGVLVSRNMNTNAFPPKPVSSSIRPGRAGKRDSISSVVVSRRRSSGGTTKTETMPQPSLEARRSSRITDGPPHPSMGLVSIVRPEKQSYGAGEGGLLFQPRIRRQESLVRLPPLLKRDNTVLMRMKEQRIEQQIKERRKW